MVITADLARPGFRFIAVLMEGEIAEFGGVDGALSVPVESYSAKNALQRGLTLFEPLDLLDVAVVIAAGDALSLCDSKQ